MNKFIILTLLITSMLFQSCGTFVSTEPEITEKSVSVAEESTSTSSQDTSKTSEEIETLKDEKHRQ